MDRLRRLIRANPHILGGQPVFEDLIEQLNDSQAERLADMVVAFIRSVPGAEIEDVAAPTLH